MKVIYDPGIPLKVKKPILTIGVFDGLHRGHRFLIQQVIRRAHRAGVTSCVMTFHPHPVHVLHPRLWCPQLISLPQRLRLLKEMGVDLCLVIPFTKRFSRLSAEKFIQEYIVKKINPQEIILGDDFRFGQNREGTLGILKALGERHGFNVRIIKAIQEDHLRISSTVIRKLIVEGKLKKASHWLGRPISVGGRVVPGDSRGKKLGFPTANIHAEEGVFVPRGVYFVKVKITGKMHQGIANIGVRPSFAQKKQETTFEVHILDFHKNIYGRKIIIEIFDKLRDERHFNSTQELIAQIQRDEQKARRYFQYYSPISHP